MVLQGRSELGEAAIIARAIEFFVGQHNLAVISETRNAVSFSGDEGSVNVTVSEEGPDSDVQLTTDDMEEAGTRFMEMVSQIGGG